MKEQSCTYPPWRAVLEEMYQHGVTHGRVYTGGWFEQRLSCHSDSLEFASAIFNIREELEDNGLDLRACGSDEKQFVILELKSSTDRMLAYQRHAIKILRRAIVLGENTSLQLASESQRRRHEAAVERIAKRLALTGRRLHNPQVPPTDMVEPDVF